ncbi:uncharacterized protein LOC132732816 isoform X2 [Ruditapes philippinarum]|uniref:uncharacterized protein LOC132732816 isoform X1 n=1 Tax=Ruditapes philippinarum TaxID=129788 RepID=UPI00295A584E|nr:uncharacterized protein LOC132732816 isoform X1 [Ruditapes philippinarum]XP_060575309.1 uncharacterized protein LOC132732816 isoform X2 [Ruditapes philippinarum]
MVAKQKLPGFVNLLFFLNTLRFFSLYCEASSDQVQYCWSGTEDDISAWMNLTCSTNQSNLPNLVSSKALPTTNQTSHDTTTMLPQKKYYCMAFQYNETTENSSTGEKVVKFMADYSCDMENLCDGRSMYSGYTIFSDKRQREGHLYCCDSGNNCNTHMLVYKRINQHTCYIGDRNTFSLSIDHCPHQKTHCVKTVVKQTSNQSPDIETIQESYTCDINNKICSELTEAENHSCKETKTSLANGTTFEKTVCCCKGDNCYKPPWADGVIPRGVTNKHSMQNTWQRTMLIIIGVALGILVVGVTLFFVRRSIQGEGKSESPSKQYNTAYRSMTMENGVDTDDRVQILAT